MVKLTEEAKKLIRDVMPVMVATASKDGKPNVSPKGSLRILDDEHVGFADMASPRTIANLRENPQISIIIFNPDTRRGYRIWGKAEILESGKEFDAISAEFAAMEMKVNHLAKVEIEELATV